MPGYRYFLRSRRGIKLKHQVYDVTTGKTIRAFADKKKAEDYYTKLHFKEMREQMKPKKS